MVADKMGYPSDAKMHLCSLASLRQYVHQGLARISGSKDLRAGQANISKASLVEKSPKNKLFDVSFPKFMSTTSAPTATPPMASKAARTLGTSSPTRGRNKLFRAFSTLHSNLEGCHSTFAYADSKCLPLRRLYSSSAACAQVSAKAYPNHTQQPCYLRA
jgi:hypothetical protein